MPDDNGDMLSLPSITNEIVNEYFKSGSIKEVARRFNLTYWKVWRLLNKLGIAHKYHKPRICPILVDYNDSELTNLDEMRLRLPNDIYLKIVVIKATDELLWAIGHALGDGTYTEDSFRLLGSPKKLPVKIVIEEYVDRIAKTFTNGKYYVDYFIWDEEKKTWTKVNDLTVADKWQIRLESRVLSRIYKAIRKNCEFMDVLAKNWEPVFAGIFDSDGYQRIQRGKWIIISQSIGEKFNAICQLLRTANICFRLWSGGSRNKLTSNGRRTKPNYHLAVDYEDVKHSISRYSLRMNHSF